MNITHSVTSVLAGILAWICITADESHAQYPTPGNYYEWVNPPPTTAFVGDVFNVSAYVSCYFIWDVTLRNYATYITNSRCSSVNVTGSNWLKRITALRAGTAPFIVSGICNGSAHHGVVCTSETITVYALTQKLASVSINAPTNMLTHTSTQLTFTAISAGSTTWTGQNANWSVSPSNISSISTSGLISIQSAETVCSITVSVSYIYLSIEKTSSVVIMVSPLTSNTPIPIPYSWLDAYYPDSGNYNELAYSEGSNGYFVWESFVAGLIPTNSNSKIITSIGLLNGAPIISWTPNLGAQRVYNIEGKAALTDQLWGPTNSGSRYFRVNVSMP